MKSLKFFLLEESKSVDNNTHKINWLLKSSSDVPDGVKTINYLNVVTLDNLPNEHLQGPVLNFGGSEQKSVEFLKTYNNNQVYNKKEDIIISSSKVKFHELLKNKTYIPNTLTFDNKSADLVSFLNKVQKLKFPIIGKPSQGHSGLGIVVINNKKDLNKILFATNKSKSYLNVFSEMIQNIKTEFRFFFVKGTLFLVSERVPSVSKNKTINTKNPDEKLEFVYIEQDFTKLQKTNILTDIKNIVNDLRKYIKLDFFALDVILDNNNKLWVLEVNSAIGMGPLTLSKTYQAIYKDYYGCNPPYDVVNELTKVEQEYNQELYKTNQQEFEKSLFPVDITVNT